MHFSLSSLGTDSSELEHICTGKIGGANPCLKTGANATHGCRCGAAAAVGLANGTHISIFVFNRTRIVVEGFFNPLHVMRLFDSQEISVRLLAIFSYVIMVSIAFAWFLFLLFSQLLFSVLLFLCHAFFSFNFCVVCMFLMVNRYCSVVPIVSVHLMTSTRLMVNVLPAVLD